MERVKKGENYWYVNIWRGKFEVFIDRDYHSLYCDDNAIETDFRFTSGNYFHTKEEAESMARKLNAVIKGADVIEKFDDINICDTEIENDFENGVRIGWQRCYNWIKSKIIK